jgi:hypothetical protein
VKQHERAADTQRVRFWVPFAFLIGATALSLLLLDTLGTASCAGIFGAGVAVFVLGLVLSERDQGASPRRLIVHFGLSSERTAQGLAGLIERSGDPSLCRLRPAPRARTWWGTDGLELAEPGLVAAVAGGTGLLALGEADRVRLARTIEWLLANSDGELTFELTAEQWDAAHEIEISASHLAGLVAAGEAATDVRYIVPRTT